MTETLVITVFILITLLLLLANFAWKKQYFSKANVIGPINAEVVAVKRPSSRDRERDRGRTGGGTSYSIRVNYEIDDGSQITTHLRVRDTYSARLPEGIIEAAGITMDLGKVKNRMQEAYEISKRMSAEGKSKDEIKKAVADLTEQRVGAIDSKTEELGLAHGWRAVSGPTTIPVLVSTRDSSKVILYTAGLSSTRS